MNARIDELRAWIGRAESRVDHVTPMPVAALAATLDRDDAAPRDGDLLPPLWHWLYFLPIVAQSQIGDDGHPKRGGFLPPVLLPRRMWAGGRLEFHRPLRVGEPVTRLSRIVDVDLKQGRSGELVFVKVRHEISDSNGLAITEEQDIVYRDQAAGGHAVRARAAPESSTWMSEIRPSEVMLFRYSALTFNSHRIHFDRPYATSAEGYPALVVHGPLIATLLVDVLRRNMPDARIERFAFRSVAPLFDTGRFYVCGQPEPDGSTIQLWAKSVEGTLAMEATVNVR